MLIIILFYISNILIFHVTDPVKYWYLMSTTNQHQLSLSFTLLQPKMNVFDVPGYWK